LLGYRTAVSRDLFCDYLETDMNEWPVRLIVFGIIPILGTPVISVIAIIPVIPIIFVIAIILAVVVILIMPIVCDRERSATFEAPTLEARDRVEAS
jgi:uncharacterized membrane protein (DUF106 family)